MIFKSAGAQGDLNGFLDVGSHFHGELRFDNMFRIDGHFTGRVNSEGTLMIGERGHIEGEIHVGQVYISGTVEGTIHARRKIHLAPDGKVYANLETPALEIEEGALFVGNCAMPSRQGEGRQAAPPVNNVVRMAQDR